MLIRSQDRKKIVNIENIDTICIMDNQIYCFNNESSTNMGMYSSEEKAIKALNRLEDGIFENRVFQMPQDSEV